MIDTDKRAFMDMLNAVHTIYDRPLPNTDLLRIWWHKLDKFEIEVVSKALDSWTNSPNHMPQPAEIAEMCKPLESVYKALPAPVNQEVNQAGLDKMNEVIIDGWNPRTDYRQWARRIMANPKNFPTDSVLEARKVLGV